jgi:hypothetical protein
VRDRQADLWEENVDVWRLYHQLVTRFLVDGQLLPVALTRLTAAMDLDAFSDALDRLAVIYDVLQPPKAESPDGA